MKVKELIQILEQYDPETLVAISGYEGGYTENIGILEIELYLNVHEEYYYGEHDTWVSGDELEKVTKQNFVVISR